MSECILGTSVSGNGRTIGGLTVQPMTSYGAARLQFTLSGTTYSRRRGVNGPVAIYSAGTTPFVATQTVDLSNVAFSVCPPSVDAKTNNKTLDVKKIGGGFGSRFIEAIAKKKVAEKKSQANAVASVKAERRIGDRFYDQNGRATSRGTRCLRDQAQ